MRNTAVVAVMIGMLMSVPALALASQPARHATRGVVKSVNATTLVITQSPRSGREMVFAVNPSTERDGKVTVGSTVEVRWTEAKERVATVISVQGQKP